MVLKINFVSRFHSLHKHERELPQTVPLNVAPSYDQRNFAPEWIILMAFMSTERAL